MATSADQIYEMYNSQVKIKLLRKCDLHEIFYLGRDPKLSRKRWPKVTNFDRNNFKVEFYPHHLYFTFFYRTANKNNFLHYFFWCQKLSMHQIQSIFFIFLLYQRQQPQCPNATSLDFSCMASKVS